MGVPSGANSRPPCASKPFYSFLWQSTNFVRRGGISGLISFAAYSWNRILRPSSLELPCVGCYRAYLEIRSPSGRRRQWPRNLICQALTDWEKRDCSRSIIDFPLLTWSVRQTPSMKILRQDVCKASNWGQNSGITLSNGIVNFCEIVMNSSEYDDWIKKH